LLGLTYTADRLLRGTCLDLGPWGYDFVPNGEATPTADCYLHVSKFGVNPSVRV
jgi:hypothetical protein